MRLEAVACFSDHRQAVAQESNSHYTANGVQKARARESIGADGRRLKDPVDDRREDPTRAPAVPRIRNRR